MDVKVENLLNEQIDKIKSLQSNVSSIKDILDNYKINKDEIVLKMVQEGLTLEKVQQILNYSDEEIETLIIEYFL